MVIAADKAQAFFAEHGIDPERDVKVTPAENNTVIVKAVTLAGLLFLSILQSMQAKIRACHA